MWFFPDPSEKPDGHDVGMAESTAASDPGREARVRKALADEHRVALLETLRARHDGVDVQELAELEGLHPNTVRWHLAVLGEAGLVESRRAESHGPGRPRILYTASAAARAPRSDEHRLLATILAELVAGDTDATSRAERAGFAWGEHLPVPLPEGAGDAETAAEVCDLLDRQGFAPEAPAAGAPGEIALRMRRCPFHDLAETHPEVVCGVHRGLIDGVLSGLGGTLRVRGLDVLVEPDLCVLHLASR